MKRLKRLGIVLGSLIAVYYVVIGAFYLAGWRWYRFPTAAMHPTLPMGSHAFGRLSRGYKDRIKRFDIVIYGPKEAPTELWAKRVVGLPGERVVIGRDGITVNRVKLNLPPPVNIPGLATKTCEVVVPADAFFVLGDNTSNSMDSRYVGPISKQQVVGQILFKE